VNDILAATVNAVSAYNARAFGQPATLRMSEETYLQTIREGIAKAPGGKPDAPLVTVDPTRIAGIRIVIEDSIPDGRVIATSSRARHLRLDWAAMTLASVL
jgi:hypothetical protein